MIDLDDLNTLEKLDTENVLEAVEHFSEQVAKGWEIGRTTRGLPDAAGIDSVVVLGMGGSGVSGDVVQAVVEPRLPVPFRTIKSYGPLPEWIGRNTLVFAVSYSGSTEETLAAVDEVRDRGGRAVTVSSGGPLAEVSAQYGFAHIGIPSGLQPRASLGFLTLPIFGALVEVGLVPDLQDDVTESIKVLGDLEHRCRRENSRQENPAKDLAARIIGRIPVVYGGHPLGSVAAYRFKCDLNEYGKTPAFWNQLPELDHNEIVGWNKLSDLTSENFMIVLLRDSEEHERVALRFDITRRLTEKSLAEVVEVHTEGVSPMSRLLSLVLVTQLASIYVGLAYEVDPGPVAVIQKLKAELASR